MVIERWHQLITAARIAVFDLYDLTNTFDAFRSVRQSTADVEAYVVESVVRERMVIVLSCILVNTIDVPFVLDFFDTASDIGASPKVTFTFLDGG
jgi:hypothetical protein